MVHNPLFATVGSLFVLMAACACGGRRCSPIYVDGACEAIAMGLMLIGASFCPPL